MGKLYVIGVGGTGARVMHSLLMLFATGQRINASEIVPMVIDTDVNNGNLSNYKKLTTHYSKINERLFSNTDAETASHFFHTKVRKPVNMSMDGRQFDNLKSMINYTGMLNYKTKRLVDLLFSRDNLEMPLEKGFIGNPNIGSVVLNEIIEHSDSFVNFTQEFAEGDRIFIVSSIFGGTGAAGFPLLLNNLRHNNEIEKSNIISEAIIGAVTVLPYFAVSKLEDEADKEIENYDVDSNTFILKSKAALAYYDKYVTKDVDALYFLGDYHRSTFKNQKGGEKQKNPASFIELSAALSIIDFMDLEPEQSKRSSMKSQFNFGQFSIKEDVEAIDFKILHKEASYTRPLIKYHLFRLYFKEHLVKSLKNKNLRWKVDLELDEDFYTTDTGMASDLKAFFDQYDQWLKELSFPQHGRKFTVFKNGDASEKNILALFSGKQPKMNKGIFAGESIPKVEMNKFFNDTNQLRAGTPDQKFMHLMNEGIDKIYQEYFHE